MFTTILIIVITLIPALLLRWALLRRSIGKVAAFGIAVSLWLFVFSLLIAVGEKSELAGAIAAPAAIMSFYILRSEVDEEKEEK